MAKTKISEYSSTAANNTDINGINTAENMAPSNVNNAIRELMAQLKNQQTGTDSADFTVGGNLTVTGSATASTPSAGDNSTKVATTAFVTVAVASAVSSAVPTGCIVIWSGASSAIPSGWYLCNGSNGTPDLRDRFVVGVGSTYSVGNTGGSKDAIVVSHSHSVSDPGHSHTINGGSSQNTNNQAPSKLSTFTTPQTINTESATTGISIQSTGASGTNANLPPYYALCYIMKG